MPTYVPTEWSNEAPAETPIRYTLRDALGEILYEDVTIELATSVTPGTALNSTQMNHIENGIKDAQDTANLDVVTAKLVDGILSADAAGRAKMADGFITLAKLSADLKFQKLKEFVADGSSYPDWTSIPATFRNLIMLYNGVSSRTTAGFDYFYFRVNADATTIYQTFADNLPPITNPHNEGFMCGILPSQNAGYLPTGSGLVIFPNYAGDTYYKSCMHLAMWAGTYSNGFVQSTSVRNDVAAISRLTGRMNTGVYPRAGSVFSLYGFN